MALALTAGALEEQGEDLLLAVTLALLGLHLEGHHVQGRHPPRARQRDLTAHLPRPSVSASAHTGQQAGTVGCRQALLVKFCPERNEHLL